MHMHWSQFVPNMSTRHPRTLCSTSSSVYQLNQGPGEIKRKEVSWTLTKKLDAFAGPGEIKRRDPPVNPGEIKNRQVEPGLRVRLLLLHLFPNCGTADIVFVTLFRIAVGTAIAWYGSCWGMPSAHSEHRFPAPSSKLCQI